MEDYFYNEIKAGKIPRDVIQEMLDKKMIKSKKQAHWTLTKWTNKGIYDYGVSLDLGWLEEESSNAK